MSDDKDKSPIATISGLAIILAALGFTIFTPGPFKSIRPSVPEVRVSAEKVEARLWQDPFRAVLDQLKVFGSSSSAKSAGYINLFTAYQCNEKGNDALQAQCKADGKTTVLGVMVPGASYAEDTEQRTRYRYAVLSGLRRLGFIPEDSEHLGYYITATNLSDRKPKILALSNIMPFECLKNPDNNKSVLVIWINDNSFNEKPLSKLACLAESLRSLGILKDDFKVLGPAGSTTLQTMIEEAADGCFPALSGLVIYSPMATADDSLLLKNIPRIEVGKDVVDIFCRHNIRFVRTVHSDRDLADLLIYELSLRNVRLENKSDHIVLISEWDTFYGRSLPTIFKQAVHKKYSSLCAVSDLDARVHYISYMRGLDGSLPGEKEEKKDEKSDVSRDPTEHIKNLEQPMGKSQYDYLRRLSQEIYILNQKDPGCIKAIGVLGSDFYDKYLVLQALRKQIPEAVFFTTDIDARYLHPDAIKWTRNLVVASNFDLSLRNDSLFPRSGDKINLQGDVPPFRDNYQTSIFFTTLLAFVGEDNQIPPKEREYLNKMVTNPMSSNQLRPLIFEIGRHSAVKLSADAEDIHPPRRYSAKDVEKNLIKAIYIAALLAVLLIFTSGRIINLIVDALRGWMKHPRIVLEILALLTIIAFWFHHFVIKVPSEEPFSLFEGISIWPTEALRIIYILLSAGFIMKSWRNLRENRNDIEKEFGLMQCKGNYRNYAILNCMVGSKEESLSSMDELWAKYVMCDTKRYLIARQLPIVFVYIVLCGYIFLVFGIPTTPVRGLVSLSINNGILLSGVIAFIVLVFYVFGVTRNCQKFIDYALKNNPEWSPESISKFMECCRSEVQVPIKEWMLVKLIARRTDAVGQLVFYPFIVWFIMFVARIHFFDNWRFNIGLIVVFTLGLVYAWSCAFSLRQAAERARKGAIGRLKEQILKNCNADQEQVKRIETVLNEIKSIGEGAFLPFMQHPIVQALFLPFGGIGGLYLLDFLEKMNP